MRVELNPCYILHNRSYRETSLILDIFSRRYGRISLVAKGARKQKNVKRALLQPGRKINIAWTIRRELGTLTGVEPGPGNQLFGADRLLTVFYINELLTRLLHRHEPHPELFDAYETALSQLNNASTEQVTLRIFEKRLLEALGYGLVLDSDTGGNVIQSQQNYNYRLEQGPVPGISVNGGGMKISGRALLALAAEKFNDELVLAEAKQLMRMALGVLLGDKPLVSRELYSYNKTVIVNETDKTGR